MAVLPVFCDKCGGVWGAKNVIRGDQAKGITLTNISVGPCPNCGGTGHVPDGVYDLMDDTLKVANSAGLSPATLQGIIELLEAAGRGEASDQEVLQKVETEAPTLAPIVDVYLQKPDKLRWIAVLIALLGVLIQGPGTVNDAAQLLDGKPPQGSQSMRSKARGAGAKTKKSRRKRPRKTHGKNKKRRPRG